MTKICKICIFAPTVISKVSTGWIFRKYLLLLQIFM